MCHGEPGISEIVAVGSHERVADPILVSCGWPRRLVRAGLRFVLACRHDVGHATGIRPPTCATPGNVPPDSAGSPRPGSVEGSATSARRPPVRPARRNPASPDPAGHRDRRTAALPPATTSGKAAKRTRLRQEPQRRHFLQTAIDIIANRVAVEVDGRFGPATTTAVMNFQTFLHTADASIAVDGVVGPVTWRGIYYLPWPARPDSRLRD